MSYELNKSNKRKKKILVNYINKCRIYIYIYIFFIYINYSRSVEPMVKCYL